MVVEGCVKVLETMYGRGRKLLKLHGLKHPKTVPKTKFDQKITYSIPHIWSFSFNFRFSSRKSQTQQKLVIKITHFAIQFCLRNLSHFTHSTLQKVYCHNTAKNLTHFTNFRSKMFLVSLRKHSYTAPFQDVEELRSQSNWKQMSLYCCISS